MTQKKLIKNKKKIYKDNKRKGKKKKWKRNIFKINKNLRKQKRKSLKYIWNNKKKRKFFAISRNIINFNNYKNWKY